MPDVSIKYKGSQIASMDASGSKTLTTSGLYMEGDVVVDYTDPEKPTQTKSVTLSESSQDIAPDSGYVLSSVSVPGISKTYVGSSVPRQSAKTVTPTKSAQTAVASGTYTTGAVSVGAIPAEYIIPTGSETKTSNGTYDVKSLAEIVVNVASSGGGGLPAGISKIDFGAISVSSAFTTTKQTFQHKLGAVPDFVMVYAPANVATTYSMLGAVRGTPFGWRSGYNSFYFFHGNSTSTVSITNSNNANYGIGSAMTATTFTLASHSTSYYWRAGSYNYIAIKFS